MSDQRIDDRIHNPTPATNQDPVSLPNEPYYQQPIEETRRNPKAALGMMLVLIGLIWIGLQVSGGSGLFSFGGRSGPLYEETLTGNRLELDAGSGDVTIRSWNNDGIHITAIQEGGPQNAYAVDVRQSGDTVRVSHAERDTFCFFCNTGIRYEIDMPATMQASIQTGSGEIKTDGTAGTITLTSASGDIEAKNSSNTMMITTASGTVALEHATGALTVKTMSGDIELENATGTLDLESSSGEIQVRDGRNVQLTASTSSGDIRYSGELLANEQSSITTTSGEVHMKLPDDSAIQVGATTSSGEIDSDFNLSDAATLTIETNSGDIKIERD